MVTAFVAAHCLNIHITQLKSLSFFQTLLYFGSADLNSFYSAHRCHFPSFFSCLNKFTAFCKVYHVLDNNRNGNNRLKLFQILCAYTAFNYFPLRPNRENSLQNGYFLQQTWSSVIRNERIENKSHRVLGVISMGD